MVKMKFEVPSLEIIEPCKSCQFLATRQSDQHIVEVVCCVLDPVTAWTTRDIKDKVPAKCLLLKGIDARGVILALGKV